MAKNSKLFLAGKFKFFEIVEFLIKFTCNILSIWYWVISEPHYLKEFEFYRQKIHKYFFDGKIQIKD